MLSHLRIIRRKLLQKNKLTTYLLYAIGEIILVVIGILIAVSINDWNAKANNQELVKGYKTAMKKELEQNLKILEGDISYLKENLALAKSFKEKMGMPSATVDTLIHYAKYDYIYSYDPDVSLNFNTFKTLESTGHISLLKPSFRDSLYSFQESQTKFTNLISYNIDFFKDIDTEYHTYYPTSGNDNVINDALLDQFWEDIDRKDFVARFNAIASNKYITEVHILRFKNILKSSTVQFITYLDSAE